LADDVLAERDRRHIHDAKVARDDLVEGQLFELGGLGIDPRILGIDAVDPAVSALQDDVGFDLGRALAAGVSVVK